MRLCAFSSLVRSLRFGADDRMITALYSAMALASFAVASKDFRKGYRVSGFAWVAMGCAWLLAVLVLVSGLGVIS